MGASKGLQILRQIYASRAKTGSLLEGLLRVSHPRIEWWAAGPSRVLPWAGTFRGHKGVKKWFMVLNQTMAYERFEPLEQIAAGNTVVEIIHARGYARGTGRRFKSDITRVWTFRNGKVLKVRSYYDTAAYVTALSK